MLDTSVLQRLRVLRVVLVGDVEPEHSERVVLGEVGLTVGAVEVHVER